jgi:hypothetical protein
MSYKVVSSLPSHLVEANPQLVAFLKRYYQFMEQENGPSYAMDQLLYLRDIDAIGEEFIEYLQREFAQNVPKNLRADKRKLYKHIIDLYRSRGSIPSFVSGFSFLFNEQIELYYPRVDILKPSDGKWNQTLQKYTSNDGFLSDTKYLQDSYYYQSFSYVIKTGQGLSTWRDYVKKILHPAGFRFFGEILIQSTAKGTMKLIPRDAGSTDIPPLVIDTEIVRAPLRHAETILTKEITALNAIKAGPTFKHFDQTESTNNSAIYNFYDIKVADVIAGEDTNFVHPATVEAPDNTNPS